MDIWNAALDDALGIAEITSAIETLLLPRGDETAAALLSALREHLLEQQDSLLDLVSSELADVDSAATELARLRGEHSSLRALEPLPKEFEEAILASQQATASAKRELDVVSNNKMAKEIETQMAVIEDIQNLAEDTPLASTNSSRKLPRLRRAPSMFNKGRYQGPESARTRRLRSDMTALDRQLADAIKKHDQLQVEYQRIMSSTSMWRATQGRLSTYDAPSSELLRQITEASAQYEAAMEITRQALVEKAMVPAARAWINSILQRNRNHLYRTDFDTADTSGLRQMSASEHQVSTTAFERLDQMMSALGGGVIGISGSRGAGKSTVMRAVCTGGLTSQVEAPVASLVVDAPIEYIARDFVIHLFASLCKSLLKDVPDHEIDAGPANRSMTRLPLLGAISMVVGGLGIIFVNLMPTHVVGGAALSTVSVGVIASATPLLAMRLINGTPPSANMRRVLPFGRPRDIHMISGVDSEIEERQYVRRIHPVQRISRLLRSRTYVFCALLFALIAPLIITLGMRPHTFNLSAAPSPGFSATQRATLVATMIAVLIFFLSVKLSKLHIFVVIYAGIMTIVFAIHVLWSIPVPNLASIQIAVLLAALGAFIKVGSVAVRRLRRRSATTSAFEPIAGIQATNYCVMIVICNSWAFLLGGYWDLHLDLSTILGFVLTAASLAFAHEILTDDLRSSPQDEVAGLSAIEIRSRAELSGLQFQQTRKFAQNEALKLGAVPWVPFALPLSAESTTSRERSYSTIPKTYPEIVADFHRYVAFLATQGRVLIGIDELDKMTPEMADRFLNEVKVIFDGSSSGCYYMVSVSEDALASFRRRGVLARDVFDSTFDDMLVVSNLNYSETVTLLEKRIIDLPRGVAALCYLLAAGLPRDVIRTMRLLVSLRHTDDSMHIALLAESAATYELRRELDGFASELRHLQEGPVDEYREWAESMRACGLSTGSAPKPLADIGLMPDAHLDARLRRSALAHLTSWYQLKSVVELFAQADSDTLQSFEASGQDAGIDVLAGAREQIPVAWQSAWDQVSRFRSAWDLPEIARPVHSR